MKSLFSLALVAAVCFFMASCGSDDPTISGLSSPRDGAYPSPQAEIYIDDVRVSTVSAVTLESQIIMYTSAVSIGYGWNSSNDPVFNSNVKISGFPVGDGVSDIEFITTSTLSGFVGTTRIGALNFAYEGRFTGDAYSDHAAKSVIINFESIQ